MISASDSYMRRRLLSAPPLKCTRFLFVGSKVNSLQVLGFSPKRLQRYNNSLNLPNLGALFLNFSSFYSCNVAENPENPDRYANPEAGFVMQVSWRLSEYVVLILC